MISEKTKIYIAGINGMVGSACKRIFIAAGYENIVGLPSDKLNLKDKAKVYEFLHDERPDVIINAAAKVGGILANNEYPYDFLLDNLEIQNNLISSAHELNIQKFIFLGSSCIYPKLSKQPIKEEYLLSGSLEETNQWYAIAKISGIKLIESLRLQYGRDYISLMPTNLYGPNDNFDKLTSHVIPAMIRKFHDAKIKKLSNVELWGSGYPKREFLHVNDLANSVLHILENDLSDIIYNVGTGKDISIFDLAQTIKEVIDYDGDILWDKSKPDGTPRKLLDVSKINNTGWKYNIPLIQGIQSTYEWFLTNENSLREIKL